MLLQLQEHVKFGDVGYEMCYRIARKALSDRPWYFNTEYQGHIFIPVMETEKYIIDFILKILTNSLGKAELSVHRIYDDYSLFRNPNSFIPTDFRSIAEDKSVEILPFSKDGFNHMDIQNYPGLDFQSEITIQEFLNKNREMFDKGRLATDEEIAQLARSIIRHDSVFQEDKYLTLHANIRINAGSAHKDKTPLYNFHIGLLVEAARRAVPIIMSLNERKHTPYPIDTLTTMLSWFPSKEIIQAYGEIPSEEEFNDRLIGMLTRIANSMVTDVPYYLVAAALYYLQENDPDATEKIRDLLYSPKVYRNNTVFLSKGDTVFEALAAASVFNRMRADVDEIENLLKDRTADTQSLQKELEIASVVDAGAFYMFIGEIIRQGDYLGFDVREPISTFLLDDDKISDLERNVINEIIKTSRMDLEEAKMEVSNMDTKEAEKICENVELANGKVISVSARVNKKFSFIDKDEIVSVTIERGMSDNMSEHAKYANTGCDPYGFLDLISSAINTYRWTYEGDYSEFEKNGAAIGAAISQIYSDLGFASTNFIVTRAFETIVVPRMGYTEFSEVYFSKIREKMHMEELKEMVDYVRRISYKARFDTHDKYLALILLAAASENYVMDADLNENEMLDWIHFALHNAFGIFTSSIEKTLTLLCCHLERTEKLEEVLESIFDPDLTPLLFELLFQYLIDDDTDIEKARKDWMEKFKDTILIAYVYLRDTVYSAIKDPELHQFIEGFSVDEERISEMGFLIRNHEYSETEIILRTAWTLPWMEDIFGPVLDKLKDSTATLLGVSVSDIEHSYFDFQEAAKNFDQMYNEIGLDRLLTALQLIRDTCGRPVTTELNKFRVLAMKSVVDSDPIPESAIEGSRDIDKAVMDFFKDCMDEYNYLYDAMKMICG